MKREKGFTLIELLIVLTILAILVAVVTVALTQFVGKGKEEACATDRRTLETAVTAFYTETDPLAFPRNPDGTFNWIMPDKNGKIFNVDYILETPESDTTCGWSLTTGGYVYVPTASVATCACCEIVDPGPPVVYNNTWCGTPP